MKKRIKKRKILLIICILVIIVPYIPVEYRTFVHESEFTDEYEQTNMIDNVKYLKVFEYSSNNAKILYVTPYTKNFVYFTKKDNKWIMDSWDCVWSSIGSASDFTFPFY